MTMKLLEKDARAACATGVLDVARLGRALIWQHTQRRAAGGRAPVSSCIRRRQGIDGHVMTGDVWRAKFSPGTRLARRPAGVV